MTHSEAADALDVMTWQEFEMLVGEAFRLQDYSVAETGGGGADGGIDEFWGYPRFPSCRGTRPVA